MQLDFTVPVLIWSVFSGLGIYHGRSRLGGRGPDRLGLLKVLAHLIIACILAGQLREELFIQTSPKGVRGDATLNRPSSPESKDTRLVRFQGTMRMTTMDEILKWIPFSPPPMHLVRRGDKIERLNLQQLHDLVDYTVRNDVGLSAGDAEIWCEQQDNFVPLTQSKYDALLANYPIIHTDGQWRVATRDLLMGVDLEKVLKSGPTERGHAVY